jgi:two-component system response regulator AtoC
MSEVTEASLPLLKLLIVEDDVHLRTALASLAEREGFTAIEATTMEEARKALVQTRIDAVLVDLTLPDGDGLELIGNANVVGHPEYIVVTGNSTAQTAVDALRRGALDYLTKPLDRNRLVSVLANLRRTRSLKTDVSGLREHLRELGHFGAIGGRSGPMQKVYALIQRVAETEASIFVTGESGTGKELVAETIHTLSRRRARPFLAVNCGSLSPSLIESELFGHEKGSFTGADRRRIGYFERATGGSLFLDEITEMPLELQVKLLRVLETGSVTRVGATAATPVDVRILAAANRDPLEAVEKGRLREDLFYRLNVFPIHLPPLRQRGADISLLAQNFLDQLNAREGSAKLFAPSALERLQAAPWPGNVRELKNVVERAAILADELIGPDDLPLARAADAIVEGGESELRVKIGSRLADVERRLILATLEALAGNKSKAAEMLGISLKTLYNRLNMYQGHGQNERHPKPSE